MTIFVQGEVSAVTEAVERAKNCGTGRVVASAVIANPHEETMNPVSYTHLDVYKRQLLVHPGKIKSGHSDKRIVGSDDDMPGMYLISCLRIYRIFFDLYGHSMFIDVQVCCQLP